MSQPYIIFSLVCGASTLLISRASVYRLMSYDGIESTDIELNTANNAIMDGGYVQSTRLGMRSINIKFAVSDKAQTETLRAVLISFFKPKSEYTLYVTRNGVTRRIYCNLSSRPDFEQPNIIYDWLQVSINLTCPNPYFLDETDTTEQYLVYQALLNFPVTFFPGGGLTTGVQVTSNTISIVNSGDEEIGVIIDILADKGSITNPKITLDGVDYVKVVTVLTQGSTLTIDTRPGKKDILIDDVSSFIYDITSVFFSVPVGTHTLVISADAGVTNADASFTYALKYLGV